MISAAFRVDAHPSIGSGHFIRCLTLARCLQKNGVHCTFYSFNLSNPFESLLREAAIDHIPLKALEDTEPLQRRLQSQEQKILITDNYHLNSEWEIKLSSHFDFQVVIDDLGRDHACDLLVDQNLYVDPSQRYPRLLKTGSRCLIGPQYALLRDEFSSLRKSLRPKNFKNPNVLVFYGGSDATGETIKALSALQEIKSTRLNKVFVCIGAMNSLSASITELTKSVPNGRIIDNFSLLPPFMADSDICLGAGGTTTWERCCLGIPTLTTVVADNQVTLIREASLQNLLINLGSSVEVTLPILVKKIQFYLDRVAELEEISRRCLQLVDGQGTARIATFILEQLKK